METPDSHLVKETIYIVLVVGSTGRRYAMQKILWCHGIHDIWEVVMYIQYCIVGEH